MPPLLASRLDRGAEIFRRSAERAPRPVVSGGQGRDELVSEAAAMRDYPLARTIPPDAILVEDAATTTEENLRLSLALLDPPTERVAAVTNNFHVFRTAMPARSLRLPVDVIGSPTAVPPPRTSDPWSPDGDDRGHVVAVVVRRHGPLR